jgi:hypothetical protein
MSLMAEKVLWYFFLQTKEDLSQDDNEDQEHSNDDVEEGVRTRVAVFVLEILAKVVVTVARDRADGQS